MRLTGKELLLGVVFAGAAVGVALMGDRESAPYPYLFDASKATTDQQRFLAAVIHHHGVTEAELQPLTPKLRSVWRDLPMIVWVARQTDRPLLDIAELRRSGQEWIEIYRKFKLPLKPLFEGVTGTAPEPYRAAWMEWRMKYRPALDDDQMRELALLQMAQKMSGDDMETVLKKVRRGSTTEQLIARAAPEGPPASPAAVAAGAAGTAAPGAQGQADAARKGSGGQSGN
ncbi:MAG TPA: hypothetical protein VFO85_06045 [Vicinamibacteria bacterium]|nr:hypothetical protein [Vicinamibacteria bacterium]